MDSDSKTKRIGEPTRFPKHDKEIRDFNELSIKLKLHFGEVEAIKSFDEIEPLMRSIRTALESCKEDIRLKH